MSNLITRRSFCAGAAALVSGSALPMSPAQAALTLRYGNSSNQQALSNPFIAGLGEALAERTGSELSIQLLLGMSSEQTIIESLPLRTLDIDLTGYTRLS